MLVAPLFTGSVTLLSLSAFVKSRSPILPKSLSISLSSAAFSFSNLRIRCVLNHIPVVRISFIFSSISSCFCKYSFILPSYDSKRSFCLRFERYAFSSSLFALNSPVLSSICALYLGTILLSSSVAFFLSSSDWLWSCAVLSRTFNLIFCSS